MEQHKITAISCKWQNKSNQPYKDKKGNHQCRVSMQTEQGGNIWFSCFAYEGDEILNWKKGDIVEIEISEVNGFYNFRHGKAQVAQPTRGAVPAQSRPQDAGVLTQGQRDRMLYEIHEAVTKRKEEKVTSNMPFAEKDFNQI